MKKGMSKLAQATAFIIIAIFIVGLVVVFIFMQARPDISVFRSEIDNVKSSISQCGEDNTRAAVKRIGIQGGYFSKPSSYDDLGWAFIPYYYNKGDILIPNKTEIENQIGLYVDNSLGNCLSNIYSKEYKLDFSNSDTKASISPGKIKFSIDLPIAIKKGEEVTTYNLKDDEIVYNSSLYEIYEVADYITKSHVENSTQMCVNCIVEMAKERDLYVDFIDYKDSTTLVMLSENHTYKEPYLFEFLNKY